MTDDTSAADPHPRTEHMTARTLPTLGGALVAVAGVLATLGIIGLIVGDDGGRANTAVGALLAAVVGYGALLWRPDLRPASLATIVIGVPLFFLALFASDDAGVGAINGALLLATIALLLLYALDPRLWGRTPLLGTAAALVWFVLVIAVVDATVNSVQFDPFGQIVDASNRAAWTSLVVGVIYVLGTWALDRRGLRAAGTGLIAIGVAAFVFGTAGVLQQLEGGTVAKALFVVAAGLVLGWVGHCGQRRLSTWTGAVGVLVGTFSLAIDLASDNTRAAAAIALVIAVIIAALTVVVVDDPNGVRGVLARVGVAAAETDATDTAGASNTPPTTAVRSDEPATRPDPGSFAPPNTGPVQPDAPAGEPDGPDGPERHDDGGWSPPAT